MALYLDGTNTLTNPSFETAIAGEWTGGTRTAGGLDGSWKYVIPVATSTGDYSAIFGNQEYPAASPGEDWAAKVWVESGSGTPEIYLRFWDSGFGTVASVLLTATGETSGGWAAYEVQSTAPASTAMVTIVGFNQHASQTLAIDAASVVEVVVSTETETLAPDAVLASSNLTGATLANIDEDPAANDGSWAVATSNNVATSIRVSFPTPSAALSGDQTFRALVRKTGTSGSGTPTATLSLYENGSLISADTAENVTSTTGQVISYTWSSSGRTASQIECLITGTQSGGSPGARAAVDIGAVAWDATIESTGTVLVDWTPTGGITLAGSPSILRAHAATGSGGVTLAGTAVLARTVVQSVSGGVTFAGGAATPRVWDVTVSGGVTLGGTAPASKSATYEVTPSGGVTLGGAASVAQVAVYTVTPSGGITLSGAATVALVWDVAPAGGVVLGGTGSGAYSATYTVVPDGGVTFGGTAAHELTSGTQEFTHTPTGGIAFGGAADASQTWAHTPAGGVVFAGAAETAQIAVYTVQPVGGLDLAGTAVLARLWAVTGTSGVTLAGAAALNQTWVHAPTGGITFAGSAPVSTAGEFVYQPSGGVAFAGAGGVSGVREITPSGGFALDGAGTIERVHAYLASDGLVLGGGADVATVRVVSPDGGIVLAGDGLGVFVQLQLVFLSSVSGGDRAAVAVAGGDRGAVAVVGGTVGVVAVAAGDGGGVAVAGDNRAAVSVRGGDSRP